MFKGKKKSAAAAGGIAARGPADLRSIFRELRDIVETTAKAFEKLLVKRCRGIRERVVLPETFFTSFDKSRAAEVSEVAGNLGLRDAKHTNEIADAELSGAQKIEDAQAGAVGEGPEEKVYAGLLSTCFHIRLGDYSRQGSENQAHAEPEKLNRGLFGVRDVEGCGGELPRFDPLSFFLHPRNLLRVAVHPERDGRAKALLI
jgi:hypothetical protein